MEGKTGLVLEGGGMRGMYTAGVLDAFMDNDIKFECAVGVSAGACFGINIATHQRGRAIRYCKKYNKDKKYMGIIPLVTEKNIMSLKYAYEDVPMRLDPLDNEAFKKSGMTFYAVVTNADTGKPEYMQIKDIYGDMDIIRATGAIPVLMQSVDINGTHYMDGGISDSIPFEWMNNEKGYEKQIVVLTRDASYRKSPENPTFVKLTMRKNPKIVERMLVRHEEYNSTIERLSAYEKDGRALVIRPSEEITIGRLEKDEKKLQEVYDLGYKDCVSMLDEIKEYMRSE